MPPKHHPNAAGDHSRRRQRHQVAGHDESGVPKRAAVVVRRPALDHGHAMPAPAKV
jgi:hypothetical protein